MIAIGRLFGLGHSSRLIHDCIKSSCVDSVVTAETATETEVESTSAISSEVQSQSHNSQKELVWPEKSIGVNHWDLVAGQNAVAQVCFTADVLARPADDHGRSRHDRPAPPCIRRSPRRHRRASGPPENGRSRLTYEDDL